MKVNIVFVKGTHVPGHGSVVKLDGVEAEDAPGGLRLTTPAGKVRVPWDRIETVLEAIPIVAQTRDVTEALIGAVEQVTKFGGSPVFVSGPFAKAGPGSHGQGVSEQLAAPADANGQSAAALGLNGQAAAAQAQGNKPAQLQPQGGKKGRR